MSGYNIYVWDADQYNYIADDNDFFDTDNIPKHDTHAENYNLFIQTIDDFIIDAQLHYEDMMYGGHSVLDSHITIEPIPYEILTVYNLLIIETAVNNNLCVYNPLSDTLETPADKKDYKKGKALEKWQQQKQADAEREALLASEPSEIPRNEKEANKLLKQIVKDKLKQAGVKTKKDSDRNNVAYFDETYLEFSTFIECDEYYPGHDDSYTFKLAGAIYIYNKGLSYNFEEKLGAGVSDIGILFYDAFDIPSEQTTSIYHVIHDINQLKYEINRGVDLFIDIYNQCQTREGMFKFALNTQNDPRIQRKMIDKRRVRPVSFEMIALLAYLTKDTASYEALKQEIMSDWIAWEHDDYEYEVRRHNMFQEKQVAIGNIDKPQPYPWPIEGDIDEHMRDRILKWLALLESKTPKKILSED